MALLDSDQRSIDIPLLFERLRALYWINGDLFRLFHVWTENLEERLKSCFYALVASTEKRTFNKQLRS